MTPCCIVRCPASIAAIFFSFSSSFESLSFSREIECIIIMSRNTIRRNINFTINYSLIIIASDRIGEEEHLWKSAEDKGLLCAVVSFVDSIMDTKLLWL